MVNNLDAVSFFNRCNILLGKSEEPMLRYLKVQMRRRGWKLTETKDMPGLGFIRMMPRETKSVDFPCRTGLEMTIRRRQQLIKSFKGSNGFNDYYFDDIDDSE